jgi:hypothetical protein
LPQATAKAVVADWFLKNVVAEAQGLKGGAMAGARALYALEAEALTR